MNAGIANNAGALMASGAMERRRWLMATLVLLGSGAIIAGAIMPWLSLFAGLMPQRGIIGLNGRLVLAGGIGSAAAGLWYLFSGSVRVRLAAGILGALLTVFTGYLLAQLIGMHRELAASQPMLVPTMGPGLYMCLAGAVIVAATLVRRE